MNSWNKSDLHHILTEGDKLYKTLNTFDILSVDDLPRFVKMYGQNVQIEFLKLGTELARLRGGDPFLRNIILNTDNILFLLLKFRYTFEIGKYIQVAYLEFRDKQQLYFQAQFIKLKTSF